MSTININSSDIRIFPISFDRSKGSTYTLRTRNATEVPKDAPDKLKNYLEKNSYIIGDLPSIDGISLRAYYDDSISGTALQASYDNGRVLSEGNISKLISALTDTQKFVISYTGYVIEFIIRGHYFKAKLTANLQNNCYVGVNFTDDHNVYETLAAYDDLDTNLNKDVLKNVDFSSDALTEGSRNGEYDEVLQLLQDGAVPTASQFKFTSHSIQNINGGTV